VQSWAFSFDPPSWFDQPQSENSNRSTFNSTAETCDNNKLYLRTAKTGTKVYCPLPPTVTDALDAVPAVGKHFFWSGSSKPKSAVGDFQRSLRRLFDLAQMPHVHAHLFRHTYATELLTAGTSMETVAALLGHSSTKVTEKSYSHWVKGRQESLEAAVKNAWTHLDPVAVNST
jgi:integrase/recombinase XerD